MFDVFYFGPKPGLFAFEQPATSLDDASGKSRTEYYWYIYGGNDFKGFDFDYIPVPWQSQFTHVWPTQWVEFYGAYLVRKDITQFDYHIHPVVLPTKQFPDNYKTLASGEFNYSWSPHPWDPPLIYVFGNQHYPATIMPTVTYTVPGATETKYMDFPTAHLAEDRINWEILEPIDETEWDWSWVPNPKDPPYIYDFGNQWNPPEYKASVRYRVPGATETKYMDKRTVRLPQPALFKHNIAVAEFDYSWEPNPFDPPMTYVFGNQWNPAVLEPTVVYTVPGATEIKYIDDVVARVAKDMTPWELLDDVIEFDYSWRPNPTDPPYNYVFGNQWLTPEMRPALRYHVAGATEIKYIDEPKAKRTGDPSKFHPKHPCMFDYSWEPDPGSPPYNYVFGNQWYPAEIMPTVEYPMTGATETKFVDEPRATLPDYHDNHWHTLEDCEWDYSWVPDPGDPPMIYVFGNQWWPSIKMPTVEYHVAGATERKYMEYPTAKLLVNKEPWALPEEIDATNIDFSWVPDPNETPYIYHFGSDYQISTGLTYTVPGATELKFVGEPPKIIKEKKSIEVLDIFFIDKSNATAQTRYELLQTKYPKIQKVRYANNIMDTIKRCITRAKTNKFWVISSEYDYTEFDFAWHAQPWQTYMTHVFPSQHQKWSDTFLINKWEFERHSKWAESLDQFPNLNFVKDQTVSKPDNLHNIYYVDHGNQTSRHQYEYLRTQHPDIVNTRFVDNYLDTFKRIMTTAETEYVWIINSVCDYSTFDFTWQPEPWQKEMIHVFPSGLEDRGDTFYIHVESFKAQMIELDLLDWFNVINYCHDQIIERFPDPVHYYETDDLITEVKNYDFKFPYATFTNQKDLQLKVTPCLWTKKDRTIRRLTRSGATCVVPRDIKADLKSQIYDYPFISDEKPILNEYYPGKKFSGIEIIYISNGEPDEEKWYEHTCYMTNYNVKWVRGVNGRTAAYQEAARQSTTPWFFAVFAKLEVLGSDFPWFHWQPDYFQEPKHYIFNSRNPVNGLEYGHQGVVAYNKRLVLETNAPGIDFTLSQPHEVVPILSGIAHYNQSEWMTWRTAFREVVKLKHFMAVQPTLETEHRLRIWSDENYLKHVEFAEWSVRGALDAVAYYNEVSGDYEKLKLSFEWAWLEQRFNSSKQ